MMELTNEYNPIALLEQNKKMVEEDIDSLKEYISTLDVRTEKALKLLEEAKQGKKEIEKALEELVAK